MHQAYVLLRCGKDVLLGDSDDGDDGWSGVQRLRSDGSLSQLPGQRQRERVPSTTACVSRSHHL